MKERTEKPLADHFADFRAIFAGEGYELDVGERRDRGNDFLALLAPEADSAQPTRGVHPEERGPSRGEG